MYKFISHYVQYFQHLAMHDTCLQSILITIFYACLPKFHNYAAYQNSDGKIIDVVYNTATSGRKKIYDVRIQRIVFEL